MTKKLVYLWISNNELLNHSFFSPSSVEWYIKICATSVSPHSTRPTDRPTGLPRTQHFFCVSILTVFIIWNLMLFHFFMHFICLSTVA